MPPLRYSLLLLLLVLVWAISCTSILARHLRYDELKHEQNLLRLSLRRVDSDKNLTMYQCINRLLERSQLSYQTLAGRQIMPEDIHVVSQVQLGWGEFVMDLAIGTPPLFYIAIMDSGSDLIWTQCQPCKHCLPQTTVIFDPSNSLSYLPLSCSSDPCRDLKSMSCSDDVQCAFEICYASNMSLNGYMGTETFIFGDSTSPTNITNLAFGCANDNAGPFGGSHEAGLVGLGRGPLSLISQLQISTFAYCLTALNSTSSSNLLMGWAADQLPVPMDRTTPLITHDPPSSFYYVRINGISIGGTQVPIPSEAFDNGMIVDSGTTFTQLPSNVVAAIGDMVTQMTNLPRVRNSVLSVCLQQTRGGVQLPNAVLQFENMDLELADDRLWLHITPDVVCMAIRAADDIMVLGNTQQTNMQVVYDIGNGYLGFTATNCDGY